MSGQRWQPSPSSTPLQPLAFQPLLHHPIKSTRLRSFYSVTTIRDKKSSLLFPNRFWAGSIHSEIMQRIVCVQSAVGPLCRRAAANITHTCSQAVHGTKRSFSEGASSSSSQGNAQSRAQDFYRKRQEQGNWFSFKRKPQPKLTAEERNIQVAWYASAVVVGTIGATYASVPLYKMFCQATGFGGTTQRVIFEGQDGEPNAVGKAFRAIMQSVAPKSSARVHTWTDEDAAARLAELRPVENADYVTVRFDTTINDVMPWTFVPVQLDVKVVPGETALSFFTVTNHSDKAITGVATYNVHPPKMGLYFQKIQCFCFEEQRLLPGETVDMPVFFFIDPEMLEDPQVSYITDVTLSYTFFQTDEDDDDD